LLLSYATEFHIDGEPTMGRGDRKTKKGKTSIRSYGNARPHTVKKAVVGVVKKAAVAKPAVKKAAPAAKKAAPAKKST
jgi:ribosomal small subunit protein bTHX